MNGEGLAARQAAEAYGLLRWPFLPLDPRAFPVLASEEFAAGARRLEQRFAGRSGVEVGACGEAVRGLESAAAHEALYHGCFRGSAVISPFQTDYTSTHAFEQSRELADIGGFYRAFGLDASAGGVDRSDHLAAELEYLCVLAWHEAEGHASGDAERARVARDARDKFLREHAGRWFAEFAARCRERGAPALFAAAAALAAALVGEALEAAGATPRPPAPASLPMAGAP
ncbi:MAG TPA: molecular chaperone TorD family protein [Candidatus Thermoplasmatota archaeon]